ncbi:MAG: metalloregulator ArsR/SmtB family transcription factor [Acidobacteriota bacterium]|nr:metalloregulator ArsR/SmtB family transcription factor [Acidobacteriota bacterium]
MMTQARNDLQTASCCEDLDQLFSPQLLSALSDPNRIALLARLARCGRPCSVSELSECCPTDLSVVSRHLSTLKQAGVLEAEKRGRRVFYRVRYEALSATLRAMADAVEACCPPTESVTVQTGTVAKGGSR